jgi:hypothetical protein
VRKLLTALIKSVAEGLYSCSLFIFEGAARIVLNDIPKNTKISITIDTDRFKDLLISKSRFDDLLKY